MNRRIFLKALCLSPLAPAVLCAKEKPWTVIVAPYNGSGDSDDLTLVKLREAKEYIDSQEDFSKSIWYHGRPDIKWFTLKLTPEYENIPGAKEWLQGCEDEIYKAFPEPPFVSII